MDKAKRTFRAVFCYKCLTLVATDETSNFCGCGSTDKDKGLPDWHQVAVKISSLMPPQRGVQQVPILKIAKKG